MSQAVWFANALKLLEWTIDGLGIAKIVTKDVVFFMWHGLD